MLLLRSSPLFHFMSYTTGAVICAQQPNTSLTKLKKGLNFYEIETSQPQRNLTQDYEDHSHDPGILPLRINSVGQLDFKRQPTPTHVKGLVSLFNTLWLSEFQSYTKQDSRRGSNSRNALEHSY